jgi:predicted lipoprotein with Yx(FWY)xxD motif
VVIIAVTGYFLFQSNNDDEGSTTSGTTTVEEQQENTSEQEEEVSTGTVITSEDSDFGTILFDDAGQAIYIWEVEESDVAECYGDCAVQWPPVLTDGTPVAAGDVNSELLGTTERNDGTTQVTYNGHPLYYYAHEGPGEVKCHNVSTHGGLWWVVQPNGMRAE